MTATTKRTMLKIAAVMASTSFRTGILLAAQNGNKEIVKQ
jgi:hypothetical protein